MRIEIEKIKDATPPSVRLRLGNFRQDLTAAELATLSEVAFSALCDMNTERMAAMAGHCRCDINPDYVNAICGLPYRNEHGNQRFCQNKMPDGESCAHNAECHATQGATP